MVGEVDDPEHRLGDGEGQAGDPADDVVDDPVRVDQPVHALVEHGEAEIDGHGLHRHRGPGRPPGGDAAVDGHRREPDEAGQHPERRVPPRRHPGRSPQPGVRGGHHPGRRPAGHGLLHRPAPLSAGAPADETQDRSMSFRSVLLLIPSRDLVRAATVERWASVQ